MDTICATATNSHSLSICDLNTKFNDRCHTDWSKSNLISIVTPDGIYILNPQLDIEHGPFQVELIRNPTSKFKHTIPSLNWPTFDTTWQTLDNRQYMEVFMDPALITNVEKLSVDVFPKRFRLAKWSPVINSFPRHCLLASITIDYQLLIFTRKHGTWLELADLSAEYDKLWTQLKGDSLRVDDDFGAIRTNLHSLSFCHVCWKETKCNSPILLAATIPGDIVVWQRVPVRDAGDTNSDGGDEQFDVKMILRTKLEYINNMQLFESLLMVSTRDGQLVLYDLTINFNEFDDDTVMASKASTSNGSATVKTLNVITVLPTATLWHKDNIEVTDFYIQRMSPDSFRIVLAKSTNICWSIIYYSKKTESEAATLSISDSFSAIDGLDPEIALHQTPATWLRPAGDRKAALIADDGSFFQLEFIDDRQDTGPEFNAIRTGRVDLSRMIPRGLCTSPGGHLITMISCMYLMYDPARIFAPTRLILLPTINDGSFFADCMQKLTDENWLAQERVESPMDVCDRLDHLRSTLPSLTYESFFDMFKRLKAIITEVGHPRNKIQLAKLKISAFLLMKLLDHGYAKMIDSSQAVDMATLVYDSVFIYHIETILNTLADDQKTMVAAKLGKASGNKETTSGSLIAFTVDQLNSFRNFHNWVLACPRSRVIDQELHDRFNVVQEKSSLIAPCEKCPICRQDIPFSSAKSAVCSNGHKFNRCSRSLLLMDPSIHEHLVCQHCDRHYMAKDIWSLSSNLWLCLYCQ